MRTASKLLVLCLVLCLVGCTTVATFKLPQGTEMKVMNRETEFKSGTVTTTPFPWKSSAGIDYELLRKGKVVKSGKLPARFRVVSIFWPPIYAIIAWPMGFKYECYDLTKGEPQECPGAAKKKQK
jgi:hypothetical protein